jgi:hypothetical protein
MPPPAVLLRLTLHRRHKLQQQTDSSFASVLRHSNALIRWVAPARTNGTWPANCLSQRERVVGRHHPVAEQFCARAAAALRPPMLDINGVASL